MILLARRALVKRFASVRSIRATSFHRPCRTIVDRRFESTDHRPRSRIVPRNLTSIRFQDAPVLIFEDPTGNKVNWSESFQGLSTKPFPKEVADILQSPVNEEDVEIAYGIPPCYKNERVLELIKSFFRGSCLHSLYQVS